MSAIDARKAAARKAAFARRKAVRGQARDEANAAAAARLAALLGPPAGRVLSGFMPIRGEISPLPVMADWAAQAPVCVPVIAARATPLRFRAWRPDCRMIPGPFGARVPAGGAWLAPEVLIVPLLAFDRAGGRLGYGGGYYDRTLAGLRARGPVYAVGYAFGAQEADAVPRDRFDQPLDAIVTEAETLVFPDALL